MNSLNAYRRYKIIIKTELEDGYIENIRVLKQNIFTCSTTLVPQIGQILRWRRPTGDGNYAYYSGIITKVDIPLYQLRSLSVQIDDTEEIIIPAEDYNYFLINAKNSKSEIDRKILSKRMHEYDIYDWFRIRDYRSKSEELYNEELGKVDLKEDMPKEEILFEQDK